MTYRPGPASQDYERARNADPWRREYKTQWQRAAYRLDDSNDKDRKGASPADLIDHDELEERARERMVLEAAYREAVSARIEQAVERAGAMAWSEAFLNQLYAAMIFRARPLALVPLRRAVEAAGPTATHTTYMGDLLRVSPNDPMLTGRESGPGARESALSRRDPAARETTECN